jgi:hypothetical protein
LESWDGWELGRGVLAFSAALYACIWLQLSLFHWAGAFRKWEMYPPVFVTPLIILCILLGVVARDGVLGWVALGALVVGILEGLAGFYLHERAALAQVSGLSVRNLMAGPPPVLPLAYSLAGVLGLMGLLWNG